MADPALALSFVPHQQAKPGGARVGLLNMDKQGSGDATEGAENIGLGVSLDAMDRSELAALSDKRLVSQASDVFDEKKSRERQRGILAMWILAEPLGLTFWRR